MLPGAPHRVYEPLMDAEQHDAFTGSEAKINRHIGGESTTFDGWTTGTVDITYPQPTDR